ncbi:ankyrin repeat-containing domain protein [Fusarium solani]|uniref:Ankyrin repeat-containing domain protein n=1 Tax=Fusarium solani TaxID=169388 RepID=A0A9P9JZF7_FUSSL|nr:ankyrin repeat-containing domain protein [Fusarium solani]KAH7234494.1 ankyrin repeat-containing domain protein [Fusarium solani]
MDPTPNPSAPAGSLWEKALTQIWNEQLKAVLETTVKTQKRDILFQQESQNEGLSDPIDAFFPWTAIRYLLRKLIEDAQEYGLVISELEQIARVITKCAQVERQSLHQQSPSMRDNLVMALTRMYTEILAHLGRMIRYYKANTLNTMEESDFLPRQNSAGMEEILRQARDILNLAQLDEAQASRFLEPTFVRSSPLSHWETLAADSQERLNSWLAPLPLSQPVRDSSAFNPVLDDPQFRSWHLSSSSCLLFIHAPPGWCSAAVDELWDAAQETVSPAPFAHICCTEMPYGNEVSLSDAIMRTILSQLLTHKNDETKIRELLWADFERRSALARVRGQHVARLNSHECVQLILELAEQDPLTVVITAIDKVKEVDRRNLMEALKEIAVNTGNVAKILVSCSDGINVFSTLAEDHLEPQGFLPTQTEGDVSFNVICFTGCIERKIEAGTSSPEGSTFGIESRVETASGPQQIPIHLAQSEASFQTFADYELAIVEATEAGSVAGLGRLEHLNFYHQLFSEENKEKVTLMTRKAIQGGHIEALAWYLKTSPLASDLLPVDAVAVAVLYSDLATVRYLLDNGMSIETEGQFGSPLVTASLLNRQAVVWVLIQLGADVNAKGTFGSALDIAAMKGHASIVKMLLESGASVFRRRRGVHRSVLQAAAFNGHLDTVELLLDAGADDSIGGYTKDALHAAIEGGHADIVLLLLARGFPSRPRDRLYGKEQWPARSSESRDLLRETSPERVAREDGEYDESKGIAASKSCSSPPTNLEAIFEADQHPWTRKQSLMADQERGSFKYINALDSAVRAGHDSVVGLILSLADALDLGNNAVEKATVVAVEQGHFSILDLLLKHLATRIPITECLESLFDAARQSKTRNCSVAEQVFAIVGQYCTPVELDKFKAETLTMAQRYEASDDLPVAQDMRSACTHGKLDELLTIIDSRHICQLKPEQLTEALNQCAMYGHYSPFKSLFEFLLDSDYIHDISKVSDSCLVGAAANGHLDIVKLLISLRETAPFSTMVIGGALVNACERGHACVAQYLVQDVSANVNELAFDSLLGLLSEFPFKVDIWRPSRSSPKNTGSSLPIISPLQAALRGFTQADCGYTRNGCMQRNINPQSDPDQIVKVLLDLEADPNELGGQQMYPIQAAAEFCPPSVVKQLIEAGADANLIVWEDSAIFKAAGREVSSGEALKVLVDSGAKLPDEETTIQKLFGKPLYYFDPYPQEDGCSSRSRGFQVNQSLEEVFKQGPGAAISTLMALYPQWTASDERCGHVLQMAAFLNHHDLVATLLSRGVDVNAAGHYYGTALQAAARCGHNDMVLRLLSAGAQVNILQGQWETALRAAIVGGHEEVVRTLLRNGADFKLGSTFETKNHGDITSSCLQLAIRTNKVGIVNALLEAGAVPSDDESDRMGKDVDQPPLIITVLRGNLEIARTLIDSGADVNAEGRKRDNCSSLDGGHACPLCAAISKKRLDIARLLLERGADVNHTNKGCRSPLSLAVDVEDQYLVRLLLKHGAKVRTVLTEAAEHNHLGIVQDLLAARARVIAQGPWENPVIVALKKPYRREVKDVRIAEALLEVLMETPDPEPIIEKALSEAIKEDNSRSVGIILDYLPTSALRLRQACSAGADQAVKRILQQGVDPNEADDKGDYPIHLAAAHLHPAVVNTLIQHGADLNATTREGKTPLQAALEACGTPRLDLSNSGPAWHKPRRGTARKRRRLSKWPQDIGSSPPTIAFPRFHRCELIAATLLDNGASPVSVTRSAAGSPLHVACLIGSKHTVVRLLEKGADVNQIGGPFKHVLSIAIATSRPDLVALLLQHGADPNYRRENYDTPLHLAGKMNSTLSVKHLLEHGADAAKRDADGNLPLDVALKSAEIERRNSGHVWSEDTIQSLLKSAGGDTQETDLFKPVR